VAAVGVPMTPAALSSAALFAFAAMLVNLYQLLELAGLFVWFLYVRRSDASSPPRIGRYHVRVHGVFICLREGNGLSR
jgi:hypothetical protein